MTVTPDLDRRFRDAAAAEGLLDVGFDVVESPIGPLPTTEPSLATTAAAALSTSQLETSWSARTVQAVRCRRR